MEDKNQLQERKATARIGARGYLTRGQPKTGTGNMRNRPCPCGKPAKYKNCCLGLDEGWQHENNGSLTKPRFNIPIPKVPSFDLGSVIGGKNDTV